MCDVNLVDDSQVTTLVRDTHWYPSPFMRNDLFGIFDAIHENRIAVDWAEEIGTPELISHLKILTKVLNLSLNIFSRTY